MGYYAAIKKAERQQFNRELKAAAFTAWRIELTISNLLGGQGNKITYPDYLEGMGLLSEEEKQEKNIHKQIQKAVNRMKQKEAMANIDRIIAADKAAQREQEKEASN